MAHPEATLGSEDILDLISHLIDKSLVIYEEDEQGRGRYRLLETVRRYAGDRLGEAGEADALYSRHQQFFLALPETLRADLDGLSRPECMDRLEVEHDNLRSALGWCTRETGEERETAGERAVPGLRLAGRLWQFWRAQGHCSEGRQWLSRMLDLSGEFAPIRVRAEALIGAASLALDQSDYEAAQTFYVQGMALARQAGDTQSVAAALSGLGDLAIFQRDSAAAKAFVEGQRMTADSAVKYALTEEEPDASH